MGSIDWLSFPRFDSAACFAALLGTPENGRWLLAPIDGGPCVARRYRRDTLVLESEWHTPTGRVRVIDFMPPRERSEEHTSELQSHSDLVCRLLLEKKKKQQAIIQPKKQKTITTY